MKIRASFNKLKRDITVGKFLAVRELKRNNPWSTALIIFVMSLTFFNMVLMGGILIGLADGMMSSFKTYYSSDVLVKPASQNVSISQSSMLDSLIKSLPSYQALSKRYTVAAILVNEDKVKIKDTENSKIIHSVDFAIVHNYEDDEGYKCQEYIRFNKKKHSYTWEEQGNGFYMLDEKVKLIKEEDLWTELRDMYLRLKNENTV